MSSPSSYRLTYPFVVHYPIKEIPEKSVPLDFHGPFSTTLVLTDADADGGDVRGDYRFRAPWQPVEEAALARRLSEALSGERGRFRINRNRWESSRSTVG